MASILVVSGKSRGAYFPLEERTVTVGRDECSDIQILDELVSRRHMELRWDGDEEAFRAADAGSANGVFVNGRRVSGDAQLADGDLIRIGESKLWYRTRNFPDLDAAMAAFKKRGEHGRSTMIR